ncbi:DNA replication and repair protein RecF [Bifidobacterium bohemicum]|uniref:DNA replication and repair protein RecF n=1 Tax=Bifidobacterium bohemicum DSM 22767 TaxID=1437606 RepID=A0A086ZE23_9BIFI|nr:DNA replication and repair protein RecF [Bifidobacterium bohemicum DSM 22767]SCC19392.1 DNA replication and repair protein RecF [Bifidobacterium bohemicum]
MYISRLALDHFRSWGQLVMDLAPGVNILHGANGLGKTNIVEAVEVLSTGSSHRVSSSLPLVERGQNKATIRANVSDGTDDDAIQDDADSAYSRSNEKKGAVSETDALNDDPDTHRKHGSKPGSSAQPNAQQHEPQDPINGQSTTYEVTIAAHGANRGRINNGNALYMRDIVGRVPSVSFAPDDQSLITADPRARRGFLDQAAALLDPQYSPIASEFNKIAKQRVALLKQLGAREESLDERQTALSGLEVWTGQFIKAGVKLTRARRELVNRLARHFGQIYDRLAGAEQHADLSYEPSFDEVLESDAPEPEISRHFQRLYAGEVARGRNLIGPHRDELTISLEGAPAKEFASNGEMWTLALALKMALYYEVSSVVGTKPIIILDDVFAQLDDARRSQILDFALAQDQVLLTVASLGDVPSRIMKERNVNAIDVAGLKTEVTDENEALVAQLRNVLGSDAHAAQGEVTDRGGQINVSHNFSPFKREVGNSGNAKGPLDGNAAVSDGSDKEQDKSNTGFDAAGQGGSVRANESDNARSSRPQAGRNDAEEPHDGLGAPGATGDKGAVE